MAGAKECEGQWSDQQLQLARPTNEEAREDEGPDGSINKPMRDELWSIVPAAARKHPLLTVCEVGRSPTHIRIRLT